jgi:hypothetical protein
MLATVLGLAVLFAVYAFLRQDAKCENCGGCTGACHASESDHER